MLSSFSLFSLLLARQVSGIMGRVGDTMHMLATENADAIVGECSIYWRPLDCAIIGLRNHYTLPLPRLRSLYAILEGLLEHYSSGGKRV